MEVSSTPLPGVLIVKPRKFGDDRGFSFESFNQRVFQESTGITSKFVQDNHSKSGRGVLRGLHYQLGKPQGKLVRVIEGAIYDVAVDIRRGSPTFGEWFGIELSAENDLQLWVPPDFAHGFLVTSEVAQVLYKTTDYYSPTHERSILWSDPALSIDWPDVGASVVLSQKDEIASTLETAELPDFS